MKAKILTITVLLFGGLLFSSCQKDNALLEDTATNQAIMKDNYEEDNVSGESLFKFRSYPEPFANCATIEYYLPRASFVELYVYADGSEKVIRLVNEFQKKGDQKVEFNALNLPCCEYTAELKFNDVVHTITMNKDKNVDFIFPDIR